MPAHRQASLSSLMSLYRTDQAPGDFGTAPPTEVRGPSRRQFLQHTRSACSASLSSRPRGHSRDFCVRTDFQVSSRRRCIDRTFCRIRSHLVRHRCSPSRPARGTPSDLFPALIESRPRQVLCVVRCCSGNGPEASEGWCGVPGISCVLDFGIGNQE